MVNELEAHAEGRGEHLLSDQVRRPASCLMVDPLAYLCPAVGADRVCGRDAMLHCSALRLGHHPVQLSPSSITHE